MRVKGFFSVAMRLGEEFRDREDAAALVRALGIARLDQAEAALARSYPLDRYPIRVRDVLGDLLAVGV